MGKRWTNKRLFLIGNCQLSNRNPFLFLISLFRVGRKEMHHDRGSPQSVRWFVLDMNNFIRLIGYTAFMSLLRWSFPFCGGLLIFCITSTSLAVQRTGRFVSQDNLGLGDQCACNGNALFLSATHLVWHVMRPIFNPNLSRYSNAGIFLFAAYPLVE